MAKKAVKKDVPVGSKISGGANKKLKWLMQFTGWNKRKTLENAIHYAYKNDLEFNETMIDKIKKP